MGLKMAIWLLMSMALAASMYFWHQRKIGKSEQVGSAEEYSNVTLYFDPINGEGHLFLGGTAVIITFSLFSYELAKILGDIFSGWFT